jgi:hypothetical protein
MYYWNSENILPDQLVRRRNIFIFFPRNIFLAQMKEKSRWLDEDLITEKGGSDISKMTSTETDPINIGYTHQSLHLVAKDYIRRHSNPEDFLLKNSQ